MSYLRLHQPDADEAETDDGEPPCILPIRDYLHLRRPRPAKPPAESEEDAPDPVIRARILYANRRCPYCKHPMVAPLELADGTRSRNRSTLPGSATLVGFHCESCYREWPA